MRFDVSVKAMRLTGHRVNSFRNALTLGGQITGEYRQSSGYIYTAVLKGLIVGYLCNIFYCLGGVEVCLNEGDQKCRAVPSYRGIEENIFTFSEVGDWNYPLHAC